jgi:hypothetical protein
MKLNNLLEQSRAGNNRSLVGYLSHRSEERFIDSVKARATGNLLQANQLLQVSETIRQVADLLP